VYNRWLRTAGGGEKYTLALADVISRRADVELLAYEAIDLHAIGERLNLHVNGLRLRRIDGDENAIARASLDYDVFVNATFLGLPRSRAPQSCLVVYFPGTVFATRTDRRKAILAQRLARLLGSPRFGEGFFAAEPFGNDRIRWTNGRGHVSVHVPPHGRRWIELTLRGFEKRTPVEIRVTGDRTSYMREIVARDEFEAHWIPLPPGLSGDVEIEIVSPSVDLASRDPSLGDGRVVGVLIRNLRVSGVRHAAYRVLFERLMPGRRGAMENADAHVDALAAVQSYTSIIAISDYTRRWIRNYWGRDASTLYPPIDVELMSPAEKAPLVLSVGRFFTGGHCKRQDVMVQAVRGLVHELPRGWRFVFVGGVGRRPQDQAYFESVRAAAAGLPIEVLADVDGATLRRLYQEAALYWHATGFVENGTPKPVEQEHFGITTVEAMAAGAVPIVHGSGGQVEIVRSGVDGYLWRTLPQLVAQTVVLARDHALREQMMKAALVSARRFSRSVFDSRASVLLEPLLAAR
jgi:glycosyltransferase involved in cell wall biosynthesis